MDTLFSNSKNNIITPIGNYIGVKISGTKVQIYKSGYLDHEVNIKTALDKRKLVVDLVVHQGATKSKVAGAFGVSRTSIDVWLETYKHRGLEGLVNSSKSGVGRKPVNLSRPSGDKFKQLEEKRREQRQAVEAQMLKLPFQTAGYESENKDSEHFNDEYDFEENRYSGSFIYWAILQHRYKITGFLVAMLGKYSSVIYLYISMIINGFVSIEQLKTAYKSEFGRLLGIKKLWSMPQLWERVHQATSLKKGHEIKEYFFRFQLHKQLVSLWHLFIDGHFIPYTGKEKVHKNFHTQSGEMKPGQNEIFVHDMQGRVVYFDLQEGKGDMLGVIKSQSKEVAPHMGNIPPLFVADKEIWGVEKFMELDIEGVRFITWEKNTDKVWVDGIPEKLFSPPFEVHDTQYQVYQSIKIYKNTKGDSIELRRLVIWNKKTGAKPVAVTQDTFEDSVSLATAMLNRWGKSENGFKHLGDKANMHYNPVRDISEQSQKQDVPNPEFAKLTRKRAELKKELASIELKLGRKKISINKDGTVRKNKKRDEWQEKRLTLVSKIQTVKEALEKCPERIELSEIENTKMYKTIDTQGKLLWDLAEVLFWNSRKYLIQLFEEYLPNKRDQIPVLESISKSRGFIKSTKDNMIVILEALERPQFRQAQCQLCKKLNNMNVLMPNNKLLLFDVWTKQELFNFKSKKE